MVLARYGRVPVVARFDANSVDVDRGSHVIVETDRGTELAVVLEVVPPHLQSDHEPSGKVIRKANGADVALARSLTDRAEQDFPDWMQRCADWKLQLELIDIEWTLDEQLLLYVLNDRGPETTRLALLAAAGGHGIVHVQPVGPEGVLAPEPKGGCGSGGCGCGT